jgi:hypothetical protein
MMTSNGVREHHHHHQILCLTGLHAATLAVRIVRDALSLTRITSSYVTLTPRPILQ